MWQGFDMYGLICKRSAMPNLFGYQVTYTTVGTVCASSLLGGLVDLDVLDDQVVGVETLGVGVGLSILEQTEKELGGLDGPAGLGDTERLAYSILSAPYSTMSISLHFHRKMTEFPRVCSGPPAKSIALGVVVPWAVRPVEPA